ncbi:MAG: YegP family protein [Myxococcales bacterium]|nr:YegP family protein [Myxococcales bacterium]
MQPRIKLPHISFLILLLTSASALAGCLGGTGDGSDSYDDLSKGVPSIQIVTTATGAYRFNVRANNGEVVLRSENYQTLAGATNGVASVKANGTNLERYVLLQAANGDWYFNLRAGNYKIIGTSEQYSTKSNAKRGMKTAAAILAYVETPDIVPSMLPRAVTFKGLDGRYYWQLIDGYGDVILRSGDFSSKTSAEKAIDKLFEAGVAEDAYAVQTALNGQFYFVIKKGSKILAYSRWYSDLEDLATHQEATRTVVRVLTPAPKVVCTMTRVAGVPVLNDDASTSSEPGPDSQTLIVLKSETSGESSYVEAYVGRYWFKVDLNDEDIYVTLYEKDYYDAEVGGIICFDVPTAGDDARAFCEEPLSIDANLGLSTEDHYVHAFNFSCNFE